MPILVELDLSGPTPIPVAVDDRRFEFEALDGSDLIDWSGTEFIDREGIQGIDVPPRELIRQQIPNLPGSRVTDIRDLERIVTFPVTVRPEDRDYRSNLEQMRRLRRMMDYRDRDYLTAEGTLNVVAYSEVGRRSLRCFYYDGLGGDYGRDVMFSSWRILAIQFLAADPYWRGVQWSTPVVQLPASLPFLSDDPDDHPWGLSASVALGADMPVTVTGDIPSPAVIELVGPATSTHITSPQGLDISIGELAAGQTLVVDSGRRKRVLLDGDDAWGLLGPSPQWPPLTPGANTISVEVVGADEDTRARVYGTSLWETAW